VLQRNEPMGLTAKDDTLLITKVERRSKADAGGVKVGDRIVSVAGATCSNVGMVRAALAECRKRGDAEVTVSCAAGQGRKKARNRRLSWGNGAQEASAGEFKGLGRKARELLRGAKAGDVAAQNACGDACRTGSSGLPQSNFEAVRWWRQAAEQGHVEAMVSLGTACYSGKGLGPPGPPGGPPVGSGVRESVPGADVAPDYAEAVRWWQLAATEGSADALMNLGCM